MSQERTEAVVLRGVDWSETSRIVTFLTPDRGKVACLAAGAKRAKGGTGALLDTFNRLEIVYYWKEGRSVQKLAETALLDSFGGVKRDLDKTVYAAFPLELAYRAAQENEPSQALYAALVHGLGRLAAWGGDARTHVAWQALCLLRAAGYGLDFAMDREQSAAPGLRDAVRVLSADGEKCPVPVVSGAVFAFLGRYAAHHLETDFRSLRVIREMFGENEGKA
ncbi:MAG TPA: DNA repair protein RecO [Candidatus Hydrogenedentes bacterium]|nr:DNA repair protein RecO [Candidatus Hydrogenedentota bacterium]